MVTIDPPSGMVPLSVGTTTDLKAGDSLVAVGHPGLMGYWVTTIGAFKYISTNLDCDDGVVAVTDEAPRALVDPPYEGTEWQGPTTTVPGKEGSSGSKCSIWTGR